MFLPNILFFLIYEVRAGYFILRFAPVPMYKWEERIYISTDSSNRYRYITLVLQI